MRERHSTMMGVSLLYEYVTIETAHFRNRKHTNAAKGLRSHIQNLTLRNIRPQISIAVALESVEGNVTSSDIAL